MSEFKKVVQMKKEEENSWECCKVICWKLLLLIHMSRLWWTLQNSNKLTDTRCCGESFLGSGVKRLVAAPPPAAFTGYHAHAQHPKELRTYRKKSAQNIFFFNCGLDVIVLSLKLNEAYKKCLLASGTIGICVMAVWIGGEKNAWNQLFQIVFRPPPNVEENMTSLGFLPKRVQDKKNQFGYATLMRF